MAYEDVVMFTVDSSNVNEIGYDDTEMNLYVSFKNGSVYWYNGIELSLYEDLMAAPSKGQWVWQVLRRGGYEYGRVV